MKKALIALLFGLLTVPALADNTIVENLQELIETRDAITNAIVQKGGTVTSGALTNVPNEILSIPSVDPSIVAVAIRVLDGGATTNLYTSLRAALADAQSGETVFLTADDRRSFTTAAPKLEISQAVTIEGGNHTLYGLSGYAGSDYHEVLIGGSGNVTFKNMKFSEFGNEVSLSTKMMPIATRSAYTGKTTLDGVTIDKFNRIAFNPNGGTFEVTNCTITGCAGSGKNSYVQGGIEIYYATGIISDTTINGIGVKNASQTAAAIFQINQSGTGSITVKSGSYEGQFIASTLTGATGTITLEDGTFVATVESTESAFLKSGGTLITSGGWYDRLVPSSYIPSGKVCVQDAEHAPSANATWTVKSTE